MTVYKSQMDIVPLLLEAESLKYWLDGAGVYMAAPASGKNVNKFVDTLVGQACEEIAKLRGRQALHLMINNLPAQTTTPVHWDAVKARNGSRAEPGTIERWHLPLKTNADCYWWDETDGGLRMVLGIWHGPMPFWINHQVINNGFEDRIHLVVDLD